MSEREKNEFDTIKSASSKSTPDYAIFSASSYSVF